MELMQFVLSAIVSTLSFIMLGNAIITPSEFQLIIVCVAALITLGTVTMLLIALYELKKAIEQ